MQARKLDVYFEMEEKMILKSSLVSTNVIFSCNNIIYSQDKSVIEMIEDPAGSYNNTMSHHLSLTSSRV